MTNVTLRRFCESGCHCEEAWAEVAIHELRTSRREQLVIVDCRVATLLAMTGRQVRDPPLQLLDVVLLYIIRDLAFQRSALEPRAVFNSEVASSRAVRVASSSLSFSAFMLAATCSGERAPKMTELTPR